MPTSRPGFGKQPVNRLHKKHGCKRRSRTLRLTRTQLFRSMLPDAGQLGYEFSKAPASEQFPKGGTSILSLRIEKLADRAKARRAGQCPRNLTVPHPLPTEPGTLSGKLSLILIAVFVVTVVVTVFPVAVVMVMSFAPIPLTVSPYVTVVLVPFAVVSARFAPIPLPIVPYITMVLIPFAVVPARYGNDDLLP